MGYTIKTTYEFPKFIEYQNMKINIGNLMIDAVGFFTMFNDNEIQKKELKSFLKFTKDKKTLIDVGCSYGVMSIAFTYNKLDAISYAFDGSDKAMNALSEILSLNPTLNIKQIKKLVGNTDDGIPYVLDHHYSLVIPNSQQSMSSIKIDTFCENNKITPDVLKIDVEGYEYNVLLGAKNTIKTHKPLIFIEVHPKFIKQFHNQSVENIYEFFKSIPYNVFDINGNEIENYLQVLNDVSVDAFHSVWIPK